MQVVEEESLMARIFAEQQAIQEAKSHTLPPQAPPESVPTIVGNTAGAGATGDAGSAPGGGGMPVWDFWNPTSDVVNFSFTPSSGVAPLTVQFTNLTTTPQFDSYLWIFGDGNTSTDVNPTHVYQSGSTAAPYTCSLQTTNSVSGVPGTSSLPQYISASIPTVTAEFAVQLQTDVNPPVSASFTNLSNNTSNTPTTTYLWNFGSASMLPYTGQTPLPQMYTTASSYTASLQVTGSYNINSYYTQSWAWEYDPYLGKLVIV